MKKAYIVAFVLVIIVAIVSFNNFKQEKNQQANNTTTQEQEEPSKLEDKHPRDSKFYIADPTKSQLTWKGSQNMLKNEHAGTVDLSQGVIIYSENEFVAGEFVVDMQTIKDDGENEFLEKHLKNEDFFDVEKHPTAKLKINEVAETDTEGLYRVKADLTIKKITHPIEFDANVSFNNEFLEAQAAFTIDRTKWDVKYGSGKFFEDIGDKIIADQIEYTIKILAQI